MSESTFQSCGHKNVPMNQYLTTERGKKRVRCRVCRSNTATQERAALGSARWRGNLVAEFFAPDPKAPTFGDHSTCDPENGSLCPECLVLWSDVKTQGAGVTA